MERDKWERLEKQLDFIREIDKEKQIFRQNCLTDGTRKENDAEHAWHMAIMVFLLSEYANEEIDVLKTIRMLLIHDIVEIDAGDTYAYGDVLKTEQHAKEELAAKRIFGLLPEDQAKEMCDIWEEYEECITPEAKFANTLDRVQPLMLNDITGGKSWKEHGVAASQVLDRNENTRLGSEKLWGHVKGLIDKNKELGNLK